MNNYHTQLAGNGVENKLPQGTPEALFSGTPVNREPTVSQPNLVGPQPSPQQIQQLQLQLHHMQQLQQQAQLHQQSEQAGYLPRSAPDLTDVVELSDHSVPEPNPHEKKINQHEESNRSNPPTTAKASPDSQHNIPNMLTNVKNVPKNPSPTQQQLPLQRNSNDLRPVAAPTTTPNERVDKTNNVCHRVPYGGLTFTDLVMPFILLILFVLLVHPKTSSYLERFVPPMTDTKGYAIRGAILGAVYAFLKFGSTLLSCRSR